MKIHSTAIIHPKAEIGKDVEIGSFSVIGEHVKIGNGNIIENNVTITGNTTIASNNVIFPNAVIGSEPQDLKYRGGQRYKGMCYNQYRDRKGRRRNTYRRQQLLYGMFTYRA